MTIVSDKNSELEKRVQRQKRQNKELYEINLEYSQKSQSMGSDVFGNGMPSYESEGALGGTLTLKKSSNPIKVQRSSYSSESTYDYKTWIEMDDGNRKTRTSLEKYPKKSKSAKYVVDEINTIYKISEDLDEDLEL